MQTQILNKLQVAVALYIISVTLASAFLNLSCFNKSYPPKRPQALVPEPWRRPVRRSAAGHVWCPSDWRARPGAAASRRARSCGWGWPGPAAGTWRCSCSPWRTPRVGAWGLTRSSPRWTRCTWAAARRPRCDSSCRRCAAAWSHSVEIQKHQCNEDKYLYQ